jgi:cell division protein FtsB
MRKWGQYAIIVFQILLIISLARGIQLSKRSNVRIANLQGERDKLMAEAQKLQKEGDYVASPYYLEKVAREELHLSKEGETVVIIPEGAIVETRDEVVSASEGEKANWQKWWDVLSGSR